MVQKNKNDFDLQELVKSEQHQKDISELDGRIKALEDRFGSNEKIADTLCDTADKAVHMQDMLSSTFIKLVEKDDKVKEALEDFINKIDRNFFYKFVKRIGWGVYTIIVFILGIIATTAFSGFFQDFFNKKP